MIPIRPSSNGPKPAKKPSSPKIPLPRLPPISLYVHIPWCVRKCPYCDFHSLEMHTGMPEEEYLEALRADLEGALPKLQGRLIDTVFIGGGTPSLLSAGGLARMMTFIRTMSPLSQNAEITMEANPGAAEAEKFEICRASGINRLSIGVQSFNDEHLKALGRIHSGDDARRAIELAQRHFDNFNIDLMFALPRQNMVQARQDIATALSYAPPHLSIYQLTMEPNTIFAKRPPPLPDEDTIAMMQDMVEEVTGNAGYLHYEVSAYAKPRRQARHNLNYWNYGDYIGIGAGAHSKITYPDRIVRQERTRNPRTYIVQALGGSAIAEQHEVDKQDRIFEFMLNALRLTDGFETSIFVERTGLPLSCIEPNLDEARAKGLLQWDESNVRPTELGRRFLIDLQQLFLEE